MTAISAYGHNSQYRDLMNRLQAPAPAKNVPGSNVWLHHS